MTHQPNVLVVDDDANILSAFRGFLKKEHCHMFSSGNVDGAVRALESEHVDLVILDIRVKYQSGITLLIRMKHTHPSIPVIVITGHPDLVSEHDVRLYGAAYYFLKPLELDTLRKAVRECLLLSHAPSTEYLACTARKHSPRY